MAADGSLRFDTAVNTEGFKDGISVLSKAMDRLTKAVDQLSSNIMTRFGTTEQAMQKVAEGAEKASEEIESIGSSADRSTERVKSLARTDWMQISVHTMQDSAADVATAAPVSVPVAASDMGYNPEAMSAVFGKAAEDIRSWSDAINMYGQQAGFALNDLERDAAEAGQAISSGADQAENTVQRYVGFKDSVIGAFKNMPGAFALIPKALSLEISKIPGIVKSGFSKASGVISGFGKALGKGLAGKAKSAVTSLKGLSKPADKAAKSILKLSNMFKLMLIRMAMRAVVQGVKEGMQNLVQYSGDANQAMSELTSSMTYAKNSFAAAFAPILSFVVPAITVLINALATAVGYVNQFFSALGGKGTFVRAKKVNQDYAASLKKTGGAAKQAGKDAKKALAPFDDLVQIQREGADDSSGGSSGGIDPSQMFETVAIDQGISDFANKLKEHNMTRTTKLKEVKHGQVINLGDFSIEFIKTNHSIQDASALAIYSPAGIVVHTGDFKVDYTPVFGDAIDLQRFAEIGKKGVLALMCDSTNAERSGFTMSERSVGHVFDNLFNEYKTNRIIIATFASNVDRVQQIINTAYRFGRKVAVEGRSMVNVITTAAELGYLRIPDQTLIEIDQVKNYPDEQVVLITTGSQGESMAALSRMAANIHKKIVIKPNDTIIFSSNPIPGNEKAVSKVINELSMKGAKVIFQDVHVSGHACQEEIKTDLFSG